MLRGVFGGWHYFVHDGEPAHFEQFGHEGRADTVLDALADTELGHSQNEHFVLNKLVAAQLGNALHVSRVLAHFIRPENNLKQPDLQLSQLLLLPLNTGVLHFSKTPLQSQNILKLLALP